MHPSFFKLIWYVLVVILAASGIDSQCTLYTIQNGDTFFALAQLNGISVNDMINANPGVNVNNLQIGQIVCIPRRVITTPPPITTPPRVITTPPFTNPPTPPPTLRCDYVYTVKRGDQCSTIAQLFPAFNSLNAGLNCAFLQAGQRVCIGNNNGFIYNQCKLTARVRPGDSCTTIGMRTGSSLEYLYNCNPQIDLACDNINPGQILNI